MTTEELKKAIDIIAGQGNQVDCGGQLKDILQTLAMPSVLTSRVVDGDNYWNDCKLLAELVDAANEGTIFNLVLDVSRQGNLSRFVAVDRGIDGQTSFCYFDSPSGEIVIQTAIYTAAQYEGLAAIQKTVANYDSMPVLKITDGWLWEDVASGDFITCNGKRLNAIASGGKLIEVSLSDSEYEGTEISWEDAQKLIGLPIQA